jgi:hypothetical protein
MGGSLRDAVDEMAQAVSADLEIAIRLLRCD